MHDSLTYFLLREKGEMGYNEHISNERTAAKKWNKKELFVRSPNYIETGCDYD